MRRANLIATVAWLAAVPVAWQLGWLYSLAFISACSIYANFTGHLAAWRADEDKALRAQLDRIEARLAERNS